MNVPRQFVIVPFREVRHFRPDDSLHCEAIETRGRAQNWTTPVHAHEALYQFEFLSHGEVTAHIDGQRYHLNAPSAWMVPPGVLHGFTYQPESSGHVVSVPAEIMEHLISDMTGRGSAIRQVVVQGELKSAALTDLSALFANLADEFSAQRPRRDEALRAHATLLSVWFARHLINTEPSGLRPDQDELVQRFRALLERHYRKHWTIADYATALSITPDRLSRRCRTATGQSALDLVRERVILESRRLLAYTELPVTDVAHQLGFGDPAHFSKFFSKSEGNAPLAYRKAVARGLGPLPPRGAAMKQAEDGTPRS
jgi:AraC family transcriptional activator of pobA